MARKAAEPKITLSVDYQKAIQAFIKTGEQTKDLKKALSALNDEVKKTAPVNAADKAFGSFEKTVNKLAREIKGNGATTQLNQMQHALEKVGGVSKLTEVQVDNLRRKIQGLAAAGGSVPKELQGLMGGATGLGAAGNALAAGGGIGGAMAALGPQGAVAAAGLAALAASGAALTGAMVSSTRAVLDKAGALKVMAAEAQIGVEPLQELLYAAEQSGVSSEALVQALSNMGKALLNSPEKFAQLGLEVSKLRQMKPEDVFAAVAEKINGIENPLLKGAVAVDLFGKAGKAVLPLMEEDVTGLRAEFRELGLGMSGDMVNAAEALGDKVSTLSKLWEQLKLRIGEAAIETGAAQDTVLLMAQALGFLVTASGLATTAARNLGESYKRANLAWMEWRAGLFQSAQDQGVSLTQGQRDEWGLLKVDIGLAKKELAGYGSETKALEDRFTSLNKGIDAFRAKAAQPPPAAKAPGAKGASTAAGWVDPEKAEAAAKAAAEKAKKAAEELRKWSAEQRSKEEEAIRKGYDTEIDLGKKAAEEKRKQLSDEEKMTRDLHTKAAADIQKTRDADAKLNAETRQLSRATAEMKMSDLDRVISQIETEREVAIAAAEATKDATVDAIHEKVDAINEFKDAEIEAAKKAGELEEKLKKIAAVGEAFGKLQQLFGELVGIMDDLGVSAESGFYKAAQAGEELAGVMQDGAAAAAAWASGDYFSAAIKGLETIGGLVKSLRSDSTASRAGAGFLIGGPIGAMIAASIKPETQKVAEDLAREFGQKFSDELVKKIAEDAKRLGDRVAATLKNLGAIIAEAGGVEKFGVDKSISKLRDLFSAVERGQISVQEAGETFDEVFGKLIPHAIDQSTGLAKESFLELIDLQRRAGMASKEVEGYLRGQSEAGLASLKLFLDNAQVTVPGAALAIGAALAKALDDGLRSGRPMHEVLGELQPMIDAFAEQLAAAGLSGGAAFEALQSKAALFADEITGPMLRGIAGLTGFMAAAYNQGLLTQDSFAGLAAQVAATRQEMLDQGKTAAEVNAAMAPDLQRIWELQRRTGYAVDENTQKMLDEAEAAGTVGEHMMSASDRMADSMDRVAIAIEAVARGLGFLPAAAENAANGMNSAFDRVGGPRAPGSSGPVYVPGGPAPDYTGYSEPALPGYAGGTDGLRDFGAGTMAVLHGREAVVTESDFRALMAALQGGNGGMGAGMGELASAIRDLADRPIELDGEVVVKSVARRQERNSHASLQLQHAQRRARV